MSRPIRASDALRRAAHDPGAALAAVATHKIRLFVRLVDGLGPAPRRAVGRSLLVAAAGLPGRDRVGSSRLTGRVLGVAWTADRADAIAAAVRAGGNPTTTRATAMRASRLCLELGDAASADEVLNAIATSPDDLEAVQLRAEIDWQVGRYERARDGAGALLAIHPDDRDARRIHDWAQAELTVMEAGWRPRLAALAAPYRPQPGRILHLLTNSLPYRQAGYTVRTQSVGRCQLEIGLEPQMVTRAGFPRSAGVRHAASSEVVDGVTYWRLQPDLAPGTGSVDIATRTAVAAQRLVEQIQPAILQPTTNHLNAQVALALRDRYGIPVVYEVRGFLEETWRSRASGDVSGSDRYQATRAIETDTMRTVDAIVTLSDTMRTDILGRGGIDPGRVIVVPNAVDIDRFVPGPRDEALAARLGIGDEPVIGYISSFTGYEGIVYLIQATAELRRRGRTVRCLLVGDGEERAALEAAARVAGLDDGTVLFTGRVPFGAIQSYYRLIDVFVVPRTNDRVSQLVTPLKPYEAMAMARPVVVSGVPALLEIVADGTTGRAFSAEDPISLADTLEPLLDDPAERARLGSAARTWVATHRTWQQNGERYRELYARLGAL